MKKRTMKWKKFEKRIYNFFRKCNFDYVNGGPQFKVAGRQIDVLAVHEDGKNKKHFLFVDATSKKDPNFKDIRSKIIEFNDIKTDVETELAKNNKILVYLFRKGPDNDYKEVKEIEISNDTDLHFILALEDIDYDDDADEMSNKYGIKIWGSKYTALNDKLAKMIGVYAKYTILNEIGGIDLSFCDDGPDDYCVTAFRLDLSGEAAGYTYLFPMTPEKLLKLTYVYRRELSKLNNLKNKAMFQTYQRMLIEKKIKDIGENFLSGKDGFFKNNIIIVFENDPKYKPIKFTPNVYGSAGLVDIFIPKKYASIRILDGQHRTYGFLKAKEEWHMKKKNLIVVGIVPNANEEAETFLSINTKQTPVNTDILWDLYSITEETGPKATISNAVKSLNFKETRNPFFCKIYIPSNPKGNISSKYPLGLGNLGKTLSDLNLLSNPEQLKIKKFTLWKNNSEDTSKNAVENIVRFYSFLQSSLGKENEEWFNKFFMTNNGFNVTMRLFLEVLQFIESNNVELEQLQKTKISDGILDYIFRNGESIKKLLKGTSSEGGRLDAATQMIFSIWLYNNKFGERYLSERMEYFSPDIKDLIGEILLDLRVVVDSVLCNEANWWAKYVPNKTKEYASEKKKELDNSILKEVRLYFTSEGQLIEIISILYNKFFDKHFRRQFQDRSEFEKMTSIFKEKRDENLHFLPINLKPEEIQQLYNFHSKLHSVKQSLMEMQTL